MLYLTHYSFEKTCYLQDWFGSMGFATKHLLCNKCYARLQRNMCNKVWISGTNFLKLLCFIFSKLQCITDWWQNASFLRFWLSMTFFWVSHFPKITKISFPPNELLGTWLEGCILHTPHATNIQWIHSIGSLPCGKAAGTLSCEKYTATPSFSPGTGVYKNVHQITFYPYDNNLHKS